MANSLKRKLSTDTENLFEEPGLSTDTNDHFRLPTTNQDVDVSALNVYPCFLPDNHCIHHIKNWIDLAQKSIIVQAYTFSSKSIGDALIKSVVERRVNVRLLIDKIAEEKWNYILQKLKYYGIEIQIDPQRGKAHNKVIIIDEDLVITGSFNFADEENYYNSDTVIFIRDACVNKKFRDNYEAINRIKQGFFQRVGSWFSASVKSLIPKEPYYNDHLRRLWSCSSCNVPFLSSDTLPYPIDSEEGFTVVAYKNTIKKQKRKHFIEIDVCFPRFNNQNCIQSIVKYINNTKRSIFIQACSLTHADILTALLEAHKKKIEIKLLVDEKAFYDKGQKVSDIMYSGIEVRNDTTCPQGIAHSKTIIIDDDIVLTGSFNLSYNAQNENQENVLSMKNLILNLMFKNHFYKKWNVAAVPGRNLVSV